MSRHKHPTPEDHEFQVLLEAYKNALAAWGKGVDILEDGTFVRKFINRYTPIYTDF